MRLGSPSHRDRVAIVLQSVGSFVLDGALRRFLPHARLKSAPLDHEAVDDTVKDGIREEAGFDIVKKVPDRHRSAPGIEFERDDT